MKNPEFQGAGPKRKRRFGAAPWFSIRMFITQESPVLRFLEKRTDDPPGHCVRNISDVPAKHTKTNPQRPGECAWSPKPTGGNRVNRGSIPSPLPPWPPVQNLWRRLLTPNEPAQRPAPDTEPGKPDRLTNYQDAPPKPRAGAGSLERPR